MLVQMGCRSMPDLHQSLISLGGHYKIHLLRQAHPSLCVSVGRMLPGPSSHNKCGYLKTECGPVFLKPQQRSHSHMQLPKLLLHVVQKRQKSGRERGKRRYFLSSEQQHHECWALQDYDRMPVADGESGWFQQETDTLVRDHLGSRGFIPGCFREYGG